MMPLRRTPPASPATMSGQPPVLHQSEPNISALSELSEPCLDTNITSRNKRKRHDHESFVNMCEFKDEISNTLKELKKEQTLFRSDIATTLTEIKNQCSKLQDYVDFSVAKYDEMLAKMQEYEVERKENRDYICRLEDRIDHLERQSKLTSLEIKNVPKTADESKLGLANAVRNIGNVLDTTIVQSDIKDVYRINYKGSTNNTIIVDFTTVMLKSKLLTSVRTFNKNNQNNKLNTSHLRVDGPKVPIYISDHLPSKTRKLYFLARDFAAQNNYKHCWTAYGKVYLRKEDGAQRVIVNSEGDITKLTKI